MESADETEIFEPFRSSSSSRLSSCYSLERTKYLIGCFIGSIVLLTIVQSSQPSLAKVPQSSLAEVPITTLHNEDGDAHDQPLQKDQLHAEWGNQWEDPFPPYLNDPKYPDANEISKESYPGYPQCQDRINWLKANWNSTKFNFEYYSSRGVDGTITSFLNFLNQNLLCPAAKDAEKTLIRGVNLGGWFVLESWIVPSLFEQFDPSEGVVDEWTFCKVLGKIECKKQLDQHYATWIVEDDIRKVAEAGINHVRIPVGYWIMGDIHPDEPWVNGGLPYLQRAMYWFIKYNISVNFDLHCAPGSQNGFDNSGHKGPIHWADSAIDETTGKRIYPNVDRTLTVLEALVSVFSLQPFRQIVRYVELINEPFITIPIDIVKDFYLRAYAVLRNINPDIGIIIGDSFRFQAWDNFMYPPDYSHVYIDTHIYQVFDQYELSLTPQGHVRQSCTQSLPMVAVSPLSTIVGEWSLAITDCAKWLNGYGTGSRYDGTFLNVPFMGHCTGQNDINNLTVWTPEYKAFLREFFEAQIDAYEAGSSQGWFFWTIKTESAPQWNYLLGLEQGWIPRILDTSERRHPCYEGYQFET